MYHNRSFILKVHKKLGTPIFISLGVVLIGFIFLFFNAVIRAIIRMNTLETDTVRFIKIIQRYHTRYLSANNDEANDLVMKTFEYGDKLLSQYEWLQDTEQFGKMIEVLEKLMISTMNEHSKYYRSEEAWKCVKFAIQTIYSKLPVHPTNYVRPWGANWYQFSISFPRFLVFSNFIYMYLFEKTDENLQNQLVSVIRNYLPSPIKSMGWARSGPNAVMMAVPFVGAHILMDNLNTEMYTEGMQHVLSQLKFKIVTSGEGLYPDGGFVFHNNLRAYGYLYSSARDFVALQDFFQINSMTRVDKLKRMLEHPTIPLHFGPMFTRTPSLLCQDKGDYGFFVIDSIKAVTVKTEKWMLQFNGQCSNLCYYESDQTYNKWGQFWTMARMFLYPNSDTKIREEFCTYYPGVISINNKLVQLKSTTDTTETFTPQNAFSCIAQLNSVIGMYNSWTIDKFGLRVTELILINEKGYTVAYKAESTSRNNREPIKVSVNLGRCIVSPTNSFNALPKYQFEQNYSHIHTGTSELTKVIRVEDNESFDSLQCTPNNNNVVAFSNLHTDFDNVQQISDSLIETYEHKLYFENDNLFLEDASVRKVSIGVKSEVPLSILEFDGSMIRRKYGADAKILNGIYSDGKYFTSASYMTLNGKFTNIQIKS